MRLIFLLFFFYSLIFAANDVITVNKEKEIRFNSAVVLHLNGMNRRSVNQKDPVEFRIVKNKWKVPKAGDELVIGDTTITWEKLSADTSGWIRSNKLRSGYASVSFNSTEEKVMILEGKGYTHSYVNQVPRYGNVYKFTENRNPWEPEWGFLFLPVKVKKGLNEFLFQCYYGGMKAVLHEPEADVQINNIDITSPTLIKNVSGEYFGGIVILNNLEKNISGYKIKSSGKGFETRLTEIPQMIPLSVRKVRFDFFTKGFSATGDKKLDLEIITPDGKVIHKSSIQLEVKEKNETYKETFISNIDGSVQYYAVNPPTDYNGKDETALFFSLHGAAVEGYSQARSYNSKKWGRIVSPTNRRPYGFNWEDWGRLDALEVLDISLNKFKIDKEKIYLTGHSMGGHGTWHIGVTFPDKFAALGPSAGWISFDSYRYKNKKESTSKVKLLIDRTGNPSKTYTLAENYYNHGIYIIHGKDDKVVTVKQPYSMMEVLEKFHKDYVYYEEPGVGHWWDKSDEPGADCVDWRPMFDFFGRKTRYTNDRIRHLKFKTAAPGISSDYYWVTIYDQNKYFDFSSVDFVFDPGLNRITGKTENVKVMNFDTSILNKTKDLLLIIDDQKIENIQISEDKLWLVKINNKWIVTQQPELKNKSPERFGSFKDAFRHNMIFVYGTKGTEDENKWCLDKVKYDAEQFWYQGNGSIDIIADKDFDEFKYQDRNIILYGNSNTNSAWNKLLDHCPVSVNENEIILGDKIYKGKDLICFMIYPKKNNDLNSVATVSATGLEGMKLLDKRPYLKPGFTYPDFTIMNSEILNSEENGYKAAGFFGSDWQLKTGEIEFIK